LYLYLKKKDIFLLNSLKDELKTVFKVLSDLDKKIIWIFLSIPIIQALSSYYTSRKFYRSNFFEEIQNYSDPYLLEFLYWFTGDTFLALFPTIIIIHFIFKEKISNFGFSIGDWEFGLKVSSVFIFIMLIILWFITSSQDFILKYPLLNSTKYSFQTFFIYEMGMFVYLLGWEFIWRGYMLFGLEKKFGFYSVFIQMIPFTILHFGKPFLETLGSIPGGIALGILALKTRSFYYCVIVHFSVMFAIDTISILRFHSNEYGIGFNSLINILKTLIGYIL